MNYREALFYFETFNDLTIHILKANNSPQEDVARYVKFINSREINGLIPPNDLTTKMTVNDLKKRIVINFLNPFQYFSLYCFFKTYFWGEEEKNSIPVLRLWGLEYLPAFRLDLTPFGPEYHFENFFITSRKLIQFYIRYGDPTFHRFWGTGLNITNLVASDSMSVDLGAHLWHQPGLFLGGPVISEQGQGIGGMVLLRVFGKIFKKLNLTGMIGYKTYGYLEGENLKNGFIFRIGLSFYEIPGT